jgi:RNA polymerase sigma factor (sigma-70 family)
MASSIAIPAGELAADAELAEALQDHEPHAPKEAWRRFSPMVKRMIRRRFRAASDVDDLTQDVFTTLFVAIHELRKLEALRAFVVSVTLRRIGEEQRKRRRRFRASERLKLVFEADLDLARNVPLDTDVANRGACADLQRLLSRLRPREQSAYVLRFVDGLRVEEVARALEVSVPTARRSFSYAKSRIDGWACDEPSLSAYARQQAIW